MLTVEEQLWLKICMYSSTKAETLREDHILLWLLVGVSLPEITLTKFFNLLSGG